MSFENFIPESRRRVDRLPSRRKVRSYLTDTHRETTRPARSVKYSPPSRRARSVRSRIGRI